MTHADFQALAHQFRSPDVLAIALMGSYARGEQGHFSDIDLVRYMATGVPETEPQAHLINDTLVVVSDVTPPQAERVFTDPDMATTCIAGLRTGRALWDPSAHFAVLQDHARAFVWDDAMQAKANAWASQKMVGWIEEAHKGLEGLARNDVGRLLNARHGMSWGLLGIMRVQRGILVTGDNATYSEVVAHIGMDSPWAVLGRRAFGIEPSGLPDQVRAGLQLYVLTAQMLHEALHPCDRALIEATVARIESTLGPPIETI